MILRGIKAHTMKIMGVCKTSNKINSMRVYGEDMQVDISTIARIPEETLNKKFMECLVSMNI